MPHAIPTAALGAVLLAAWAGLAVFDPVVRHPVASLACFAVAFAAYAIACRRMLRGASSDRAFPLTTLVIVAVGCRLLAFPSTPSDDMHRYLWEARVLAAGHDPYCLAPDAEPLAQLAADAPEHALVNHPDWTAIYPPFMQWWQRAVVSLIPEAWALKASFLLAELGLCLVLLALLRQRGLPPARLLIYAWNPLAIHATASQGHHDVVAAALLMSALLLMMKRAPARAAAVFTCSVLAKGFALAALPAVIAWRVATAPRPPMRARDMLRVAITTSLVAGALCLPFIYSSETVNTELQGGMLDSMQRFGAQMHTNDSLHAIASHLLPGWGSRLAMLALCLTVAVLVMRRGDRDPLHASAVLIATLLLCLPTVHPWYLVLLLPFLCFHPWWGWIALSGTVALTWLPQLDIQRTGQWVEWPLVKFFEYAPLFVWLGDIAWRRMRDEKLPGPVTPVPHTKKDSHRHTS